MDIGVGYREDVDEVIEVLRQIGAELELDPDHAESILAPIQVLGLDQFADSAVIIKARIKTKPMTQWAVKRGFNRLMKYRFDELGIEIPYPHQTLYFGEDKEGRAPAAHVLVDRVRLAANERNRPIERSSEEPSPRGELPTIRVISDGAHGEKDHD